MKNGPKSTKIFTLHLGDFLGLVETKWEIENCKEHGGSGEEPRNIFTILKTTTANLLNYHQ